MMTFLTAEAKSYAELFLLMPKGPTEPTDTATHRAPVLGPKKRNLAAGSIAFLRYRFEEVLEDANMFDRRAFSECLRLVGNCFLGRFYQN